jgi:hypothetical protein
LDPSKLKEALVSSDDATALASLVTMLQSINSERKSDGVTRHETWTSVAITPDLEIRGKNLASQDILNLELVANELRRLLKFNGD